METKVNVKDKQNVVNSLKAEGYPETKLNSFVKTMKLEFMAYANLVYSTILKKTPPQLITVKLVKGSDENPSMTVSFLSQKSSDNHILFEIHQPLIKRVLDDPTDRTYATAVIHEMMLAADYATTGQIDRASVRFESKLKNDDSASDYALLHTLHILKRLRADSIAQLGRFLLAQMKMGEPVHELFAPFRQSLNVTLEKAILGIPPTDDAAYDDISIDDSRLQFDYAGPCILLLALAKMGLVKGELVQEAFQGFDTGRFLMKQDTITLLRAALSLSFADYLKGLLLLGDEYVPVGTLSEFCSILQKMVSFQDLIPSNDSI